MFDIKKRQEILKVDVVGVLPDAVALQKVLKVRFEVLLELRGSASQERRATANFFPKLTANRKPCSLRESRPRMNSRFRR